MTEATLAGEAITIDPSTGLPELPEGHFWRVEVGNHGSVWLAIRKRRKRFGSKEVIYKRVVANLTNGGWGTEPPTIVRNVSDERFRPEAILGTAKHLLTELQERDEKRMRYEKNKALLGDYPPNTLEGK